MAAESAGGWWQPRTLDLLAAAVGFAPAPARIERFAIAADVAAVAGYGIARRAVQAELARTAHASIGREVGAAVGAG